MGINENLGGAKKEGHINLAHFDDRYYYQTLTSNRFQSGRTILFATNKTIKKWKKNHKKQQVMVMKVICC